MYTEVNTEGSALQVAQDFLQKGFISVTISKTAKGYSVKAY